MAELVDALDSKSGNSNVVWVRFPLRPPKMTLEGRFLLLFPIPFMLYLKQ